MTNNQDRFGFPPERFESYSRDSGPLFRDGVYVPTREEVRMMPLKKLTSIIIDWMWDSPTDLIPNNSQITEVIRELRSREDSDSTDCLNLIKECQQYIGEQK
jgi:hypothetical protein